MSAESDLRCLIAMVSALNTKLNTLAGANTGLLDSKMDFICDMFDRPDSDTLGGYWYGGGAGFAIRGNAAYPNPATGVQGGSTALLAVASNGFVTPGTVLTVNSNMNFGVSTAGCDVPHTIGLSNTDISIEIRFTVRTGLAGDVLNPAVIVDAAYLSDINYTYVGTVYGSTTFTMQTGTAYMTTAGGAFYSGVTNAIGVRVLGGDAPAMNIPGMSWGYTVFYYGAVASVASQSSSAYTSPETLIRYTDLATHSAVYTPNTATAPISYTGSSVGNGTAVLPTVSGVSAVDTAGALRVGDNVLTISAVGNQYIATLNGVTIENSTNSSLATKERKWAGLMTLLYNTAYQYALGGNIPAGIKSFKAWNPAVMSTPPSQTGYGTYAGGVPVYQDRYHTTVNHTVVYDPLA